MRQKTKQPRAGPVGGGASASTPESQTKPIFSRKDGIRSQISACPRTQREEKENSKSQAEKTAESVRTRPESPSPRPFPHPAAAAAPHLKAVHRVEVRLSRGEPHDGQAAVGLGHQVRGPRLAAPRRSRTRAWITPVVSDFAFVRIQ